MIYFDNAATSHPKPQIALDEMMRALTRYNANPGRSGHDAAIEAARCVYGCRESIARLIAAETSDCVSFTFNCTDALNLAIKGSLHAGDHVISTMLEHNSVLRPLSGLAARRQISLTLLSPRADGQIDPKDVIRALRPNTKLIAVTHASNVTGAIQPVAAIGRIATERGVPYLIDGAQALGALPVSMQKLGCSFYAFPGHKSLLGPQGTGGLYIRKGIIINPLREGGTGTESDSMQQPIDPPERYESGTLNLPGIAALRRSTEYVEKNLAQIMMHERELTTQLYEGIKAMPGATVYSPDEESARASIVSFNIGDLSSSELSDALARRKIAVRGGLHCAPGAHSFLGTLRRGAVRASIGHANTHDEVDIFMRAVYEISRKGA